MRRIEVIFSCLMIMCVVTACGHNGQLVSHAAEEGDHHEKNEPRPFDADANAHLDIDTAMAAAAISGKRPLLVLGGNWCHDSRGLAAKFQNPELANVVRDGFELVWVDIGHRDRNMDVLDRFGIDEIYGTPTVLILSSEEGKLVNRQSIHDWRTADSKPYDETLEYFTAFANGEVEE